jgi:O-antigen ligase
MTLRPPPVTIEAPAAPVEAPRRRALEALDWIITIGLLVLLIFAVMAFGAVQEWSLLALQCGATSLLLCWALRQALDARSHFSVHPLYAPVLAFAFIVLVQIVFSRTAYRQATLLEAQRYVAYGMLFLVATQEFRQHRHLRVFVSGLTMFGGVLAMFALVQGFTSPDKLYWTLVPRFGGFIYGPYVNHSHYAGMMEMLTPFALVMCISRRLSSALRGLAGFAAILMGASLFLARSRNGILAFIAELIFLGAVMLRGRRRSRTLFTFAAVAVLLIAFIAWAGGSALVERFANFGDQFANEVKGGRITTLKDGVRMWAARPILGWGLETFPTVYPAYRSFYSAAVINEAHNDFLQVLVETGVAGFAVVLWFIVLLYKQGLRKARHWQDSLCDTTRLAALTGCTGLLAHSLGDFNLHIPANAAMFYVLAALATAELYKPQQVYREPVFGWQAAVEDPQDEEE